MKKQSIWVFQWRKSVHYWWSYILFSPECKELTSMLDPLLYRWGVPPVVIRCVHWTMQMGVLQTWIKALGLYIVMGIMNFEYPRGRRFRWGNHGTCVVLHYAWMKTSTMFLDAAIGTDAAGYQRTGIITAQIAKTLGSTSIRCASVLAIWEGTIVPW